MFFLLNSAYRSATHLSFKFEKLSSLNGDGYNAENQLQKIGYSIGSLSLVKLCSFTLVHYTALVETLKLLI